MLPTNNYSARDTAITQRPTSTALLAIDSEDRFKTYEDSRKESGISNGNPYDFSIDTAASLMNGFFTRIGVSEVVFPWVIPNINKKTYQIRVQYFTDANFFGDWDPTTVYAVGEIVLNPTQPIPPGANAMYISLTAGNVGNSPANSPANWAPYVPATVTSTITLAYGFYTPAQLAAAVQVAVRALDASLAGFTMIYGELEQCKMTYDTNSNGVALAFLPMIANSTAYPYSSRTKQLFDVLGFLDSNKDWLSTASGGGLTLCQAIRYIDIVCPQLTYNQALKDTMSQPTARDSLCRIYIANESAPSTISPSSAFFVPPGCAPTTIYRDFSQPKQIQWLPNQPIVGALRFQVFDDQGEPLADSDPATQAPYYLNRTDWSMSMLITEN